MDRHPLSLIDADAMLTDEQRAVVASLRKLLDAKVRPNLMQWYEDGDVPVRELAVMFGQMGLLGMHLNGYGCAGADATTYGIACMELEAADSGIRSLVSVQGSLAMYAIHEFGSEEQKRQWLPDMAAGQAIGCFGLSEADAGSDPGSMRTWAKRDGKDWVLNGSKMWITNGHVADVAIVWAQTDDGVRGFVVPTASAGFSATAIKHKMSLRASATSELSFDNLRLPDEASLPGVIGLRGPLSCLSQARFGIIFGVVGAARDCLETAIAYAGNRQQFDQPIAGFQLTQRKLAEMTAAVANSFLLAMRLGALKDAGSIKPEQISLGKFANVSSALDVARSARTILGGNGISGEYPIMRHMANLESVLTYEGTHEVHTLVVGQAVTGIQAFR
ncbi:MAG: hypothetical protein RL745_733 [Actinomycetota bacterium]|jgi:glutaryl-CoA dehydrogenase